MAEMTHGTVTVQYDDTIVVPKEAGTMSGADLQRLEKARRSVGVTAVLTAAAIRKFPDIAPKGIAADELENMGRQADDIDLVIADLEALVNIFKQANRLIDAGTNEMLRKVLANVRSQEKFDAGVVNNVPQLIEYFKSNRRAAKEETPANQP